MKLTREEIKAKTSELLGMCSPDKQARVSELLTELSEGFETIMSENETSANSISELTNRVETLRDVNTKLFLKVGNSEAEFSKGKENEADDADDIPQIGIESLFNDKGELI